MTDYLCSFMYYSKQPQNLIYTNISIQYALILSTIIKTYTSEILLKSGINPYTSEILLKSGINPYTSEILLKSGIKTYTCEIPFV
jgi:hypothetical protein